MRGWVAALVALMLIGGCASADGERRATRPADEPRPREAPPAMVWFGVKGVTCDQVLDGLMVHARQPGVVAPDTLRMDQSVRWCSVAGDERHGARADSWAQAVSARLKAPAIAFYVADGAWSYAIFDAGQPISAMESHYGAPLIVGDVDRAASAIGADPDTLRGYRVAGREPKRHAELAAAVGLRYPGAAARTTTMTEARAARTAQVEAYSEPKRPAPVDASKLKPGAWVVMPPMGVMLIKAIEERPVAGVAQKVLVAVDGAQTFPVPIDKASTLGMRPVATTKEATALMARLDEGVEVQGAQHYLEGRMRRYLGALKRGDLELIVDAHRELCEIRRKRELFSLEAGLLDSLQEWLIEELGVALDAPPNEMKDQLEERCD